MTEARRPRLITALSIIQMVLAAIYLGGIVNLCYLAATANGQNAADVAKEVRGLLIGAAFSGSLAFGSVIAALGLWWQTQWGRWLAVTLLAIANAGLLIGLYDEGDWEWDVLPALIPFALLLILFLLPAVGRALKRTPISGEDLSIPAPLR